MWCVLGDGRVWLRGDKTNDKRDSMRVVWNGVVWDGVDRIVGEDVLYAHEVRNRGVKQLCLGMCWGYVLGMRRM